MDEQEARDLLGAKLAEYRGLPYSNLAARVGTEDHIEGLGPSGLDYQIEVLFTWDDAERRGDIRVMGSIDDGVLRAFLPLHDSFILAPDGSFVGEGTA